MELDKEFVLTTLNDIKNRIAKGDYTSLGLPSASGFSKIVSFPWKKNDIHSILVWDNNNV